MAPPSLSPENETRKQEVMREQDRLNELKKANRTFWERKLDSLLLRLLESDSYIKTGKISSQDLSALISSVNIIPADQVSARLGIDKPTGDLFLVEIRVNKTSSVHIIDPYAVKVEGTSGSDRVNCWVEISSLQTIASLEPVLTIHMIWKPIGNVFEGIPTTPSLPVKDPGNPSGESRLTSAQNETPTALSVAPSPSPAKVVSDLSPAGTAGSTPASTVSAPVTAVAITASLMIVILCLRREKTRW